MPVLAVMTAAFAGKWNFNAAMRTFTKLMRHIEKKGSDPKYVLKYFDTEKAYALAKQKLEAGQYKPGAH